MRSSFYIGSLLVLAAGAVLGPLGCQREANPSSLDPSGMGGAGGAGGNDPFITPEPSCKSTSDCAPEKYCDFPEFSCGLEAEGLCKPRPQGCDKGTLGCGCDGLIYDGYGCAAMHGQDLADSGLCSAPSGTVACGPFFCRLDHGSYCVKNVFSDNSCAPFYSCDKLPSDCAANDCSCLQGEMGTCTEENGGVRVERAAPPGPCPESP